MITYENECCGCAVPGYPCMGDICPNINVKHLYCDKCKADCEELYDYDGEELCEECLLDSFDKLTLD